MTKLLLLLFSILSFISIGLYKALIDEPSFIELIKIIDLQIKKIEKELTDEEKEKIKLHNVQQHNN